MTIFMVKLQNQSSLTRRMKQLSRGRVLSRKECELTQDLVLVLLPQMMRSKKQILRFQQVNTLDKCSKKSACNCFSHDGSGYYFMFDYKLARPRIKECKNRTTVVTSKIAFGLEL